MCRSKDHGDRRCSAKPLTPQQRAAKSALKKVRYREQSFEQHQGYAHAIIKTLVKNDLETHKTFARTTATGDMVWSQKRRAVHDVILSELEARYANVPCDFKAVMSGGLAGSGKTTVLNSESSFNPEDFATLNPDDIKELMAEKGYIPKVAKLTPMDASPLVYHEAVYLNARLLERFTAQGKNIIYDTTMSGLEATRDRLNKLKLSGYTIKGVFVNISLDTSDLRADSRYRRGYYDYKGWGDNPERSGNGGRLLPRAANAKQIPTEGSGFSSKNAEHFKILCDEGFFGDGVIAYDNNGTVPVKLDSFEDLTHQ